MDVIVVHEIQPYENSLYMGVFADEDEVTEWAVKEAKDFPGATTKIRGEYETASRVLVVWLPTVKSKVEYSLTRETVKGMS